MPRSPSLHHHYNLPIQGLIISPAFPPPSGVLDTLGAGDTFNATVGNLNPIWNPLNATLKQNRTSWQTLVLWIIGVSVWTFWIAGRIYVLPKFSCLLVLPFIQPPRSLAAFLQAWGWHPVSGLRVRWEVSYQLSIISCQLSAVNCLLSTSNRVDSRWQGWRWACEGSKDLVIWRNLSSHLWSALEHLGGSQ